MFVTDLFFRLVGRTALCACIASACSVPIVTSARADSVIVMKTSGQEANLVKFDPANLSAPGLSVEIMQAISRLDRGLQFTGQEVLRPVRRLDLELENGTLDVFFGLVKNESRAAKFLIVDKPVLYLQYTQLAALTSDPIDIKSFDDIRVLGNDGRIGVPQGSAFVDYLHKQGGLLVDDGTVSVSATLRKLLAGRVRFVYFGGAVLRKYMQEEGLESQIRLIPTRFNSEEVCIMFSRKADPQGVQRIQKALEKLRSTGELDRIREKYGVR